YSLKAECYCLHVETGAALGEGDKDRLERNLNLARSLGARVQSVPNVDVADGVLTYARRNEVSIIVVGKRGIAPARRIFAGPSLTERIVKESGDIAVFAVQDRPIREPLRSRVAALVKASPPWQYAAALLGIAAVTGLNLVLAGTVGYWAASIPYLAAISLLALVLERRPVLVAALVSAVLWDVLFIPPRYAIVISRPEDYLMLGLYVILAATSGWATGKLKANQAMLLVREERMSLLSELASELAATSGAEAIVAKAVGFLERAFQSEALIILKGPDGALKAEPEGGWMPLDEKATSAAHYCLSSGRAAGRYTSTLPVVEWHFEPLDSPKGGIGVIGLRPATGQAWTAQLESLLRTMSRTVSLAVERALLAAEKEAAALDRESERLGRLLLDSVSHELRTPLTVIEGSASALADEETAGDPAARGALVAGILGASGRLNGIVENLLSMSRLEAGKLVLARSLVEAEELVAAAAKLAEADLAGHELSLKPEPLSISCDAGLIIQALVNLLRNAARHGGSRSRIALSVVPTASGAEFTVADDGPGLGPAELPRLFTKFFRAEGAAPGGSGLGLAICKGIVEAHGGRIAAGNLAGGGFAVSFTLPAGEDCPDPDGLVARAGEGGGP
ncbi:MAG TPA: ATP-binding protein, partial [Rectinemataceae bacterium]|nr:ATP-binding protein [Rectinemataceae bacterium]